MRADAAAAGPSGTYLADLAWLGQGAPEVAERVLLEVSGGRITTVRRGVTDPPPGTTRLPGITLPGLVNAHSHAFHRALRGRTHRREGQDTRGDFWTWRARMYQVAERLDPDTYRALAAATYAEMALAGVTCVGEFHYLHHAPGGRPYTDPNAMGAALLDAAATVGIRVTLLDTCYLAGGFGQPLEGVQQRFGDGDADAWAARAAALRPGPLARTGAAVHSVRAVPADAIGAVATWARARGAPLHVHVSEQPAENATCLAATGRTPTELLADRGALDRNTSAVHATHLTGHDIQLLGGAGAWVCLCPTTERDLADGVAPTPELRAAGARLTVGSDSHAVVDLFEEARGVELHERLRSGRRGHHHPADLLTAATAAGAASLGWPELGTLAPGAPADLVTIRTDTPRLAGTSPTDALDQVVFAATAADITHVLVNGRTIVRDGTHLTIPDVPAALEQALSALEE